MRFQALTRPSLIALTAALALTFGSIASADSLTYVINGDLADVSAETTAPSFGSESLELDGAGFELSFVFDHGQLPDPARSGVGFSVDAYETYVPASWSVSVEKADGSPLGQGDSSQFPGVEASLERFSRIDGAFDPGTGTLYANLMGDLGNGTAGEFSVGFERQGLFVASELDAAPDNLVFTKGSLSLSTASQDASFDVQNATIRSFVSSDRPTAVPTPGAAVGGMALMLGIIARRMRRSAAQRVA